MTKVVVTLNIMPESPEINLENLTKEVADKVQEFAGETETKSEIEPVAFGIKILKFIFVMDEDKGSTDVLENSIASLDGIKSVEAVDVRRAIG